MFPTGRSPTLSTAGATSAWRRYNWCGRLRRSWATRSTARRKASGKVRTAASRCFCRALRTAAGRPCMRYSRTSLSGTATQFSYIPPALWRPLRKNCWPLLWLSGSARSSAVRVCWMPRRIIGQRPRSFQLYSFLGKAVHSKMLCMPRSIPSEWEQTSPGICGGKDCGGSVFLQSLPRFRIPRCF